MLKLFKKISYRNFSIWIEIVKIRPSTELKNRFRMKKETFLSLEIKVNLKAISCWLSCVSINRLLRGSLWRSAENLKSSTFNYIPKIISLMCEMKDHLVKFAHHSQISNIEWQFRSKRGFVHLILSFAWVYEGLSSCIFIGYVIFLIWIEIFFQSRLLFSNTAPPSELFDRKRFF